MPRRNRGGPCTRGPHERVSHAVDGISRAAAATAVFGPEGRVTVKFTGTASTYPFRAFSQASRNLALRPYTSSAVTQATARPHPPHR
jgi:hypothetical protein